MKKQKTAWMILLILLLALSLTGCGQKRAEVETVLTVEQNNTGNRQMRLSINKADFEKIFDDTTDQLNEQLGTACPSELEWSYAEENQQYSYTFTLHFSSLDDYVKKVETITGKKASVTLEQPDSVFASGLLYKENFDSLDLLGWLGNLLEEQGYQESGQGEQLFSESSVKLVFCGTEYELEPGIISLDNLVRTPVERIDFLTHYKQNKHCDRQVIFTFSSDSMSKNGEEIRSYLERNKPDMAELEWTGENGLSMCTVSASDCTAKELNQFMKKILGDSESFVNTQTQQRAGIFDSASDWSELIDIRDFSYNDAKIAVGYYIQWEDGMTVTIRRQNSDKLFELGESEKYGGYQMVLEKDISEESLITEVSTTYVVEDIEVDTEFHSSDNLSRNITLVFQTKPDQKDQEHIRKKIAQKAKGIAEVTNGEEREDERSSIVIAQTGSIDDLNKGFQIIFGVQGQLAHEITGDLLEFQHSGRLVDLMDFTNFLENDPLLTTLTYQLNLPGGEKILEDTISSTVSLKQGTQEVKGNRYTGCVPGAYLSLTLNSRKWNTDGMMLFALILCFVLIILGMMVFADFIRKACVKVKDGFHSFNGLFGKNDEVLEDFPKDRSGSRKTSGSGWKKHPGVFHKKEKPVKENPKKNTYGKKDPDNPKTAPEVEYEEERFDEGDYFDPESMVEKVTEASMETSEKNETETDETWDYDEDDF